jgi:undecaprenyl pyrophosphate phosphatase UppP
MVENSEKAFQYFKIYMYCLAAIFAGYTVNDLDQNFLNKFTDIKYQSVIIITIVAGFFNFTFKEWRKRLIEIILISILTIGTLQLLRCKFRKKNQTNNITYNKNLIQ